MTIRPAWWRNLQPPAIWFTTRLLNEVGGLRVTSAWRSAEKNARTPGAAKNSAHITGWATDLVGTEVRMQRARRLALGFGARQALVHDAGTGRHLHVDWRGARG